ncbi:hypothetical protein HYW67_01500 [Candidatus Parcubacteria bacterium]|nr:hypothetical protein [Candidatus Parcubacteria bacterium]
MVKATRTNISHPALLGLLVLMFAGVLTYAIVAYSELDSGMDLGLPVVVPQSMHPEARAIMNESDNRLDQLRQQSAGDDVASIEKDLTETILVDLDADAAKVLNELQGL